MMLTKQILGAGGGTGGGGATWFPHHVAPKATWSCQNRVPAWFWEELGASAAKPAPG